FPVRATQGRDPKESARAWGAGRAPARISGQLGAVRVCGVSPCRDRNGGPRRRPVPRAGAGGGGANREFWIDGASWVIVITRDPCNLSIARIAWARRKAYHRPVNSGCNTMIAKTIQKSDERSNANSSGFRSSCGPDDCYDRYNPITAVARTTGIEQVH